MTDRSKTPLVLVHQQQATAFEIGTGALLWQTALSFPLGNGALRVARSGNTILATYGGSATVLDLQTGKVLSTFDLGFSVRSVLLRDGYTVLAGEEGVACFRDGALVWQARRPEQPRTGGLGALLDLSTGPSVVRDGAGKALYQLPGQAGAFEVALVYGDEVVQPDAHG